jgi:cytochrome P450
LSSLSKMNDPVILVLSLNARYTEMVLKETMRLLPPAPKAARTLRVRSQV